VEHADQTTEIAGNRTGSGPRSAGVEEPALHHLAFACKDVEATHAFYTEIMGFPLVHAEVSKLRGGYLKHIFYDIGDGSCIAFFLLHNVGEPAEYDTAISTGLGLPAWVNHVALRGTPERVEEVRARLAAQGRTADLEIDHGWSKSFYVSDPNGILVELCVDDPGFVPDEAEALRIMREPVDLTS
jgi:catechol 2,3-dioxygenase-like lactoylglutathione lyase family enzyme